MINLVDAVDLGGWYYAGYYANYGYEANYDVYDVSGWGPDFGDPCSYLDTMLPDYEGYMTNVLVSSNFGKGKIGKTRTVESQ